MKIITPQELQENDFKNKFDFLVKQIEENFSLKLLTDKPLTGGRDSLIYPVDGSEELIVKIPLNSSKGLKEKRLLEILPHTPFIYNFDIKSGSLLLEKITNQRDISEIELEEYLIIMKDIVNEISKVNCPPDLDLQTSENIVNQIGKNFTQLESLYQRDSEISLASILKYQKEIKGEHVLIHGDLHPGNILLDGSQWRLIDPKSFNTHIWVELESIIRCSLRLSIEKGIDFSTYLKLLNSFIQNIEKAQNKDIKSLFRWCVLRWTWYALLREHNGWHDHDLWSLRSIILNQLK